MKNLPKYILSNIIISLLFISSFPKITLAVPSVPTVPPVSQNNSTVPTAPQPPTKSEPPTLPPVPTTPGTCCGQLTPTSQPQVNPTTPSGGQQPENSVNGGSEVATGGESAGEQGESVATGQVLGLSQTSSGNKTNELAMMIIGLFIASFGVRNVIAKKLS